MLNGAYQKTKIKTQWDPFLKKKKEKKKAEKQLSLIKRPIKFHNLNEKFSGEQWNNNFSAQSNQWLICSCV